MGQLECGQIIIRIGNDLHTKGNIFLYDSIGDTLNRVAPQQIPHPDILPIPGQEKIVSTNHAPAKRLINSPKSPFHTFVCQFQYWMGKGWPSPSFCFSAGICSRDSLQDAANSVDSHFLPLINNLPIYNRHNRFGT